MKRILTIVALAALLGGGAAAQTQSHTWAMGPLTWNDFQHKNTVNGHQSYIEYYMGIDHTRKEVGGVV